MDRMDQGLHNSDDRSEGNIITAIEYGGRLFKKEKKKK
jgi:hypothetical protein